MMAAEEELEEGICLPSRPIYAPLFFAIPCYFTDQNLSSANTEGR